MTASRRRPDGSAGDAGMVTAEFAVVLPALVAVLAVGLGAVSAGTAQLRCVDAARAGARAVARGEPVAQAVAIAREVAPAGVTVHVVRTGERVTVTVRGRAPLLGPLGGGHAALPVSARSVAELEPGVTGPA